MHEGYSDNGRCGQLVYDGSSVAIAPAHRLKTSGGSGRDPVPLPPLGEQGDRITTVETLTGAGPRRPSGAGVSLSRIGAWIRAQGRDAVHESRGIDDSLQHSTVGATEDERFCAGPACAHADGELAVVVGVVMPATQQDQVGQIRASTVDPMFHVVGFEPGSGLTAGVGAASVTIEQRPEQLRRDDPTRAAEIDYGTRLIVDVRTDPTGAEQPFDHLGR